MTIVCDFCGDSIRGSARKERLVYATDDGRTFDLHDRCDSALAGCNMSADELSDVMALVDDPDCPGEVSL